MFPGSCSASPKFRCALQPENNSTTMGILQSNPGSRQHTKAEMEMVGTGIEVPSRCRQGAILSWVLIGNCEQKKTLNVKVLEMYPIYSINLFSQTVWTAHQESDVRACCITSCVGRLLKLTLPKYFIVLRREDISPREQRGDLVPHRSPGKLAKISWK